MPSLTWATGMVTSPLGSGRGRRGRLGAAAVHHDDRRDGDHGHERDAREREVQRRAALRLLELGALLLRAPSLWERCVPPVRFFLFCFPDKAFLLCVAGVRAGRLI